MEKKLVTMNAIVVVMSVCVVLPSTSLAQFRREEVPQITKTKEFMRDIEVKAVAEAILRPEVATPLMDAQRLTLDMKHSAAANKIAVAERAKNKSPYEQHVIARVKVTLAAAMGNAALAAEQYELAAVGNWFNPVDRASTLQSVAGAYYGDKNYSNALVWFNRYFEAGGDDPVAGMLRAQSYYLLGDYANTANSLDHELSRYTRNNQVPPQLLLKLLTDARLRTSDNEGYNKAQELMARYYPAQTN